MYQGVILDLTAFLRGIEPRSWLGACNFRFSIGWGRPLDQVDSIPHIDFMSVLTGRLRMLDMHWKVLDRAMNVSEVSAPGDAAI